MHVSVHDQTLDFESRMLLKDKNILNKTTVNIDVQIVFYCSGYAALYSHCEDCWMDKCPFKNLFDEWNMHELSKKRENVYSILCQRFNFPSNVVKAIKDNHEENHIRLGDALHHICHKYPNITREEVIGIIKTQWQSRIYISANKTHPENVHSSYSYICTCTVYYS